MVCGVVAFDSKGGEEDIGPFPKSFGREEIWWLVVKDLCGSRGMFYTRIPHRARRSGHITGASAFYSSAKWDAEADIAGSVKGFGSEGGEEDIRALSGDFGREVIW
jgi:hypothetical protein